MVDSVKSFREINENAKTSRGPIFTKKSLKPDTISCGEVYSHWFPSEAIMSLSGETSYTLTVYARDNSADSLVRKTTTIPISIEVNAVNEDTPDFDQTTYSVSISESISVGDAIVTVGAVDNDRSDHLHGTLTYSVINGDPDAQFQIDSSTGQITIKSPLDREEHSSYSLTVRVTDGGVPALYDTATVDITVTDVNDKFPSCTPAFFSETVAEDEGTNFVVATISCTDTDDGNYGAGGFIYTISSGNSDGYFFLAGNELQLAKTLDFESKINHNVDVTVADNNGNAPTNAIVIPIAVTVAPVNENPPIFNPSTYTDPFEIDEDRAIGDVIVDVDATDGDSNTNAHGQLRYTIESGNAEGKFNIDPTNGKIHLIKGLDRETTTTYSLIVQAADGDLYGGVDLTASVTVPIAVIDVNDNDPECDSDVYTYVIQENTVSGTIIGSITCGDVDDGLNGDLNYNIVSGSNSDFSISTAGVIATADDIDYESNEDKDLYTMVIEVADQAASPRTSTVFVSVTITAVNDDTPTFTQPAGYSVTITESTAVGSDVLQVHADDQDDGDDGEILYTMTSAKFRIEALTGMIIVRDTLDYELTTSYTFTVTATDRSTTTPRDASVSVTITIDDENDNDPSCGPSVYTNSISENDVVDTVVASLICSDADSGDNALLKYDIISSSDPGNDFTVSSVGVVKLAKLLDFETEQSYSLLIEVSDSATTGERTVTVQVGVTVEPYNEAAPTFTAVSYSTSILESANIGADVIDIDCIDTDFGHDATMETIVYRFLTSTDYFSIDPDNGMVEVKTTLDREATPTALELEMECKDTLTIPNQRSSTVTLTVTVGDINDNEPVYDPFTYELQVRENALRNDIIGSLTVTDADDPANTIITYTIVSGNSDAIFAVDTNGEVRIDNVANLDFETTKHYTVLVRAQDGGSSPLSATATVEIEILPYNEHTPHFTQGATYVENINEDAALGDNVGQVVATDGDDSDHDDGQIEYSIIDGNAQQRFYINPSTGWVRVKQSLDRETTDYYRLVIRGTDKGTLPNPLYEDAIFDVYIDDVNDNEPICSPTIYSKQLTEDVGSSVTVAELLCSDLDAGVNEQLSYAIVDGDDLVTNRFAISPAGIVTTATSNPFDYEDIKEWYLTVNVSDNGLSSLTSQSFVTVEILGINEHTPVFEDPNGDGYTTNIGEEVAQGTLVYQVFASDADDGTHGEFYFFINAGNTKGHFSIDQNTGEIETAQTLDREVDPSYDIEIICIDNAGASSLTATDNVIITINDYNDNEPYLSPSVYAEELMENISPGTALLTSVVVTDRDTGVNAQFNYAIEPISNTDSDFVIDTITGQMTMPGGLDIEKTEYYSLKVLVNDLGTPSLTSTATVNIRVLPVNEHTPQWLAASYETYVREDSAYGFSFLNVTATDDDKYEDGIVIYSLIYGSYDGLQKIHVDALTGEMEVKAALDREVYDTYSIVVQATDQATSPVGPMWSDVTVTVYILDANDNHPMFSPTVYNTEWLENTAIGTTLVTLPCSDADLTNNADLSYVITAGNAEGKFNVSSTTSGAEIILHDFLDIETTEQFVLTVTAYDDGTDEYGTPLILTGEATVTLNVLPVNEHTPYFSPGSYATVYVEEKTPIDTSVGKVSAADDDIGDYHAFLRYSIASGNDEYKWAIDEITGDIHIAAPLDRETTVTYDLVIRVSDNMVGASTILDSTVNYQIVVDDNNDNPPVFTPQTYSVDVLEGALVGTTLVTLVTTDDDYLPGNVAHTFTIENGDTNNDFEVDGYNIKIAKKLDHEVLDLYKLTIRAHNLGDAATELTADATVTINVLSENEYMPEFDHDTFTVTVSEDITLGTKIFDANATDSDKGRHGELTYFVIDGNDYGGSQFLCDRYTGQVRVGAFLDRERNETFILNITVLDNGINVNDTFKDYMLLTVVIKDVNDNKPLFLVDLHEIYVDENVMAGHHFHTIQASDADKDQNADVRYAIVGGDGWTAFSVDSVSGQITTTISTLDREKKDRYYLALTATDQGTPALSTQTGVIVWVNDLNDNDPQFTPNVYFVNIDENLPIGTTFYRVRANDADINENADLSYSITSGDDILPMFDINNNGELSLLRSPDREGRETYGLMLEVTDNGTVPRTDTASFTITLLDENDNTPVFTSDPYIVDVEESIGIGTSLIQVHADDPDKDVNKLVSYRIVAGNEEDNFRIDEALGHIISTKLLDRESTSAFNISIEAYDAGSPPQSTNVTVYINLIDVNDNFAQFDSFNYTYSILEDVAVGYYIGNITALDVDNGTNAQLRYLITSGDYGHFTINAVTGHIFAADGIDRETIAIYTLIIKVIDLGQVTMQNMAAVLVTIDDVNDNNPVFNNHEYVQSVDENSPVGTAVITVNASDVDINQNAELSYSIPSEDTLGFRHFQIDGVTGEITVKEPTDREANETIVFHVTAFDHGIPALNGTALVTITNLDVNDNRPVFNPTYYVTRIPKDYDKSDVLITVIATDIDLDKNAEFHYSLVEYTDVFNIDLFTGEINYITTTSLLLDTYKTHVVARDAGEPSLSSDLATIRVDTFDKELYSVDIQFGISCAEFENSKAKVISLLSSLFTPGFVGTWNTDCLARSSSTSFKRRLLVTEEYVVVSIYGLRNKETETIDGIDSAAEFYTREELLRVLSSDENGGDPSTALLTPTFSAYDIEKVEPSVPFPVDPTPWYKTWWGILIMVLAALIVLILICVIMCVCVKRAGRRRDESFPVTRNTHDNQLTWAGRRQKMEIPSKQSDNCNFTLYFPKLLTEVPYKKKHGNEVNPVLLPKATNVPRKTEFESWATVRRWNTPTDRKVPETPRRQNFSRHGSLNARYEDDTMYDGEAVDPVSGFDGFVRSTEMVDKLNTHAKPPYTVDPDGSDSLASFSVYCDMSDTAAVTIIHHDIEARTHVQGYDIGGSYAVAITYLASIDQIRAVVDQSASCKQFIKYDCYHSTLNLDSNSPKAWWEDYSAVKQYYWGDSDNIQGYCACGITDTCVDVSEAVSPGLKCYCDHNDNQWRSDEGYLTDKSVLPVTKLSFGDTGDANEEGYHTLGPIQCTASIPTTSPPLTAAPTEWVESTAGIATLTVVSILVVAIIIGVLCCIFRHSLAACCKDCGRGCRSCCWSFGEGCRGCCDDCGQNCRVCLTDCCRPKPEPLPEPLRPPVERTWEKHPQRDYHDHEIIMTPTKELQRKEDKINSSALIIAPTPTRNEVTIPTALNRVTPSPEYSIQGHDVGQDRDFKYNPATGKRRWANNVNAVSAVGSWRASRPHNAIYKTSGNTIAPPTADPSLTK
ncbi:protocadherin Fat 4-like [Glandiceps talaboti]